MTEKRPIDRASVETATRYTLTLRCRDKEWDIMESQKIHGASKGDILRLCLGFANPRCEYYVLDSLEPERFKSWLYAARYDVKGCTKVTNLRYGFEENKLMEMMLEWYEIEKASLLRTCLQFIDPDGKLYVLDRKDIKDKFTSYLSQLGLPGAKTRAIGNPW